MNCMTEVERMNYENCRNVAHGRQTNFQRITASPESLAEFINKAEEAYERCCKGDIRCDFCDCQWCGIAGRSELVEWLKKAGCKWGELHD